MFSQPLKERNTRYSHRTPLRTWRETKQQPSRAKSGHHVSCCLVSLHFLQVILWPGPVNTADTAPCSYGSLSDGKTELNTAWVNRGGSELSQSMVWWGDQLASKSGNGEWMSVHNHRLMEQCKPSEVDLLLGKCISYLQKGKVAYP